MTSPSSTLAYWDLLERPFETVTDASFFFQSRTHAEALARLTYLVKQETMYIGMLSGDIGCGKSMTRQVFASRIDRSRHLVVAFENSSFPFDDLVRRLLKATGWGEHAGASASSFELYEAARAMLHRLHAVENRQLVLILDEAQDIDSPTLSSLKRLTNLNDEGVGRLTILLIGQPELRPLVADLPALNQRITLRFHLYPMDADDAASYVRHRLITAGHPSGELFDEDAIAALYRASDGVAREINRLAKLSLEVARAQFAPSISARHILNVVEDLRRHQDMPRMEGAAA